MINLRPSPQAKRENIVPMINVSFLLLVFFLLSASFATPPPIELTPPDASTDATADGIDLFLSGDGQLVLRDGTQASIENIVDLPVRLHVAADGDATVLAKSLRTLTGLRAGPVSLVTRNRQQR